MFKNEFAQDLYDETLGFESLLEKWFFQPILLGIYVRFRDCKIDDFSTKRVHHATPGPDASLSGLPVTGARSPQDFPSRVG